MNDPQPATPERTSAGTGGSATDRRAGWIALTGAVLLLTGGLLPYLKVPVAERLLVDAWDLLATWSHVVVAFGAAVLLLTNRWTGPASGTLVGVGVLAPLILLRDVVVGSILASPDLLTSVRDEIGVGAFLWLVAGAVIIVGGLLGLRQARHASHPRRDVPGLPRLLIFLGGAALIAGRLVPRSYWETVDPDLAWDRIMGSQELILEPGDFVRIPETDVPFLQGAGDPFSGADLVFGLVGLAFVVFLIGAAVLRGSTRTGFLTGAVLAVGLLETAGSVDILWIVATRQDQHLGPGAILGLGGGILLVFGAWTRQRPFRPRSPDRP